ncbi:uncharacterized protein SPSC_03263 [Sporisorium scitamineum]|uniref:N-acetyltransferase domain-containing protein n=1 Tax=Sporisorium scitamineum TaxID=49012 RepID=A0A0F7SDC0_9BASI|nr:uncharacterized protein SPSC_03263 [Sporisorium scitamineum]CDW99440.1 hypothetical protein [Sporisorium scitamineum]
MIVHTQDGQARIRTAQPATGTTQTLAELNVVDPDESDVDFVLYAFDSALPYLASIGSEAQWGTVPFSEKPERRQRFEKFVQGSYDLHTRPIQDAAAWQHMAIYEIKTPDEKWTRVAAQGLATGFPTYVPEHLADDKVREATDYLYLNYLIVDRRKGKLAKGSAARLVAFADGQAKQLNKKMFYGDCWRGNGDGLLKYYQSLGFSPIGPFDVQDKHGPGLPWTGYLFSKSVSQ